MIGKCDSQTTSCPVVDGAVNYGVTDYAMPSIEEQPPIRIGPVSSPFMLHVATSSEDFKCPDLHIERIVQCPKGCSTTEFKYDFPCGCGNSHLLPAGVYAITVCKQSASPLTVGETVDITFMIEPVDDSFAAIYSNKV